MDNQVSVRASVGSALAFVREQWRLVLIVAGVAGLAQTAALLAFGLSFGWILILAIVSAGLYAALTRAAISGSSDIGKRIVGDSARIAAAMAIVSVILAIISITLMYVVMSVIVAPYADQLRAAGQDQAAVSALLQRAIDAQPNVVFWAMIAWATISFFFTSYFYVAVPASVDTQRIVVFQSWRMTSRHILRVAASRMLLLLPAFALTGAIQTIVGMAIGFRTDDFVALTNQARSNPVMFALFYGVALAVQVATYVALEAGLSTALYRALKPAAGPGSQA